MPRPKAKKTYKPKAKAPYRRTERKYEKRAPTAKASTGTAYRDAIFKTPLMAASKLINNQLYHDTGRILTGGIGSLPQRLYSANGLWDPYVPSGGHQPIGFDQIMLMYEHYTGIRAKITITFHNASSTSPVRVGVLLAPDTTPLPDIFTLMENGLVKTTVLETTANRSTGQLTLECDIAKYFGKRNYKDVMDDLTLRGDVLNNPTEQAYFCIFAYEPFGTGEDINVGFDVLISYDAIYSEPRKLPYS